MHAAYYGTSIKQNSNDTTSSMNINGDTNNSGYSGAYYSNSTRNSNSNEKNKNVAPSSNSEKKSKNKSKGESKE